jgi:hypothetical protein
LIQVLDEDVLFLDIFEENERNRGVAIVLALASRICIPERSI